MSSDSDRTAEYPDSKASRPHWMTRYWAMQWGLFCGMALAVSFALAAAVTPWAWFAVVSVVLLHFVGAGFCGTAQGIEEWFANKGRDSERRR